MSSRAELDELYRHVAGEAWKWARAIAQVESGERRGVVGDGGAAVGFMQQHADFFEQWRELSTCNRDYPICQVRAFYNFWMHYHDPALDAAGRSFIRFELDHAPYVETQVSRKLGVYNQGPRGVDEQPLAAQRYVARVRAAYAEFEA